MDNKHIPTYIINLKNRIDRRHHIINEFAGRDEFLVTIVDACVHEIGAIGLWNSIQQVIRETIDPGQDMIIICEDDHLFTKEYSSIVLFDCIAKADMLGADLLLGGVSSFGGALQVSSELFWIDSFTGTQFMIVFNRFFKRLVETDFIEKDKADRKIGSLSANKYFIHPFISVQKEFGYSDATMENNVEGFVEDLFLTCSANAGYLKQVSAFYSNNPVNIDIDSAAMATMSIPTYIINLPERIERREHILHQFSGKAEFDTKIINAIRHQTGALGLWLTIREIIRMAIDNDDDVIIICEDDHEFTEHYSKLFLFRNIIEAHLQGADYLSGGTGSFRIAIPVTKNRFWINPCHSTQFIVIFKKFFGRILDEPFDETVIADMLLGSITSHRMVIFPFISIQRDFGYSDVTPLHDENKEMVRRLFMVASYSLHILQQAFLRFNASKQSKALLHQNI